jgi:hypothetical protein
MFNSTDIAKINPVQRILPVLSVEAIGDPIQLLESESAKLALKSNTPLKLDPLLQHADQIKSNATLENLSAAATLIDNVLKHAEMDGVVAKFEAKTAITRTPTLPKEVAKALESAISKTGLFYESHISDYVGGMRSLADIKQEPQNQLNFNATQILPQQLAILETHRLAWHGEVWPGQKMDWDIYQNKEHTPERPNEQHAENQANIASDLTLHLPNLGKVTANISISEGHVRIRLLAEETPTLHVLKAQSKSLVDAIAKSGQSLDTLLVSPYA